MKRGTFLTTTALAGAAPLGAMAATAQRAGTGREYYELRRYQLLNFAKTQPLNDFLRDAALPAYNRLGIKHVGVFTAKYGPTEPTVYVLIPYPSLESFVTADAQLLKDRSYLKAGADFLDRPLADPGYVRVENSLMVAFEGIPKMELPTATMAKTSRVYEMRIYESHSRKAAKLKIDMFNDGGEIEIFRKTGLQPVLFGETIIGPKMPNLTYLLAFDDMTAHDKNWSNFVGHPDWQQLSQVKKYKDTVSNITDIILTPTAYSQL